jgi:hypothetical protein
MKLAGGNKKKKDVNLCTISLDKPLKLCYDGSVGWEKKGTQ